MKNALDWRVGSGALHEKPVAIIAGAPRPDGGIQVRTDLERTLSAQGANVVSSATIATPRHVAVDALDPDVRRSISDGLDRLARSAPLTPAAPTPTSGTVRSDRVEPIS